MAEMLLADGPGRRQWPHREPFLPVILYSPRGIEFRVHGVNIGSIHAQVFRI